MSDTSAIWTSICQSLGADSSRAGRCLDDLIARYGEEHRHYHTMELITLGAPKDSYDRYSRSIRQEYHWVPEDQYREGRLTVLRSFTERREIFFVEEIRKQFESQARANLEAEIGTLEAAGR
ncbi:MAG: hypothetical protein AB7W16_00270 [Candidatus Obscuribacterales bacterium]